MTRSFDAQRPLLGGISAAEFLRDYWQKKPLLIRQAMPEVIGMFEPQDLQELALEAGVTARLLLQQPAKSSSNSTTDPISSQTNSHPKNHPKNHDQWTVKNSPLAAKDFKKLPTYWTLLVQAVDHWSPELAALWHHFDFIPEWRRDDVMISYAPKGGSVGKHFDYYDVFLVQGYGARRWQLGQQCDATTPLVPNQPLRLLQEMPVWFDEVLQPGDMLYVPPGLAHYGVAENDCLTLSFGFRMPTAAQLMERWLDTALSDPRLQIPLSLTALESQYATTAHSGEMNAQMLAALQAQVLQQLTETHRFADAALSLSSESRYPDTQPEGEYFSADDLRELLAEGATLQREPAVRLLYQSSPDLSDDTASASPASIRFWAQGEPLDVAPPVQALLKRLADGEILSLHSDGIAWNPAELEAVSHWLEHGVILLIGDDSDEAQDD